MKQREIDEKLEKLGIERRNDHQEAFNMRGRATSVSLISVSHGILDHCSCHGADIFARRPRLADIQAQYVAEAAECFNFHISISAAAFGFYLS